MMPASFRANTQTITLANGPFPRLLTRFAAPFRIRLKSIPDQMLKAIPGTGTACGSIRTFQAAVRLTGTARNGGIHHAKQCNFGAPTGTGGCCGHLLRGIRGFRRRDGAEFRASPGPGCPNHGSWRPDHAPRPNRNTRPNPNSRPNWDIQPNH